MSKAKHVIGGRTMKDNAQHPNVVIIGAGPVGIAAAAHLIERGVRPLILEKGPRAGHAVEQWGHVRVFTPWQYVTDKAVVRLLQRHGWAHPDQHHLPNGREIVEQYLVPAAALPEFADNIVYDATVLAISKQGVSKSSSRNRDGVPFTIHVQSSAGAHRVITADAVIDASGTWSGPNPIGADGLPVAGEAAQAERITYGIPDVLGTDRALYEGKRTLVLGGGHSAINAALDILRLKQDAAATRLIWGLRRNNLDRLLGGGLNDELPARGALGIAAKAAIDDGALEVLAPVHIDGITGTAAGLDVALTVDGRARSVTVDRIIVAAGFRPDLDMLRELRLDLDEVVEAPRKLAPLIDPNLHSCGTVPPHGIDELSHPDKNFFVVGMKAYGRAPTFLMLTGYEQVRSIADELVGNHAAARTIELDLPETGVCNTGGQAAAGGGDDCCGPAAKRNALLDRCCG